MGLPVLRPYQADGHVEVRQAWQELGPRSNVLRILPTGGGKSVEVAYEVALSDTEGTTQCVIAHRQELVGQMSLHVARTGVKHRIIGPDNVIANITADHRREFGQSFIDPKARCSVAGVDTLVSRQKNLVAWGAQVGKWVTDEAHHVLLENKWGAAIKLFPNAYGLGVTAYEKRADGQGIGRHADGVFDRMVIGPNMRDLIRMGSLTDYEIVIPETDFDRDSLKSLLGKCRCMWRVLASNIASLDRTMLSPISLPIIGGNLGNHSSIQRRVARLLVLTRL
jgi:superfamily II DNA or RNA helicase